MNGEDYENIEGWCGYCKLAIKEGEPFVVKGDVKYHIECHEQMGRYWDSLSGLEENGNND